VRVGDITSALLTWSVIILVALVVVIAARPGNTIGQNVVAVPLVIRPGGPAARPPCRASVTWRWPDWPDWPERPASPSV
jgi:hypothetical protein